MTQKDFFKDELTRAGMFDTDGDYDGALGPACMELYEVFSKQGHSGYSARMVAGMFWDLVQGKPLSPLTGVSDEWIDVCDDYYQNKRCPEVFREKSTGQSYYLHGYAFRDDFGRLFTNKSSRKYLEFPCYIPETEIVERNDPRHPYFKK